MGFTFRNGCTSIACTGHAISQLKHVQQSRECSTLALLASSMTMTSPGQNKEQIPHPMQTLRSILRIILSPRNERSGGLLGPPFLGNILCRPGRLSRNETENRVRDSLGGTARKFDQRIYSYGYHYAASNRELCPIGAFFQPGMSLNGGACFQRDISLKPRERVVDHPGHGDRYERCEAENSGAGEVFFDKQFRSNSLGSRSCRWRIRSQAATGIWNSELRKKRGVRTGDQQQLDAARERPAVHDRAVANRR